LSGSQLRALLWLRLRLVRNQLARSGGLGKLLGVLMGVVGLGLAAAGFTGGLLVGWLALRGASPLAVALYGFGLGAAFTAIWMVGVFSELTRSELFDLHKLMHLPVALAQTYAVNYLASLAGPAVAFFAPAVLGSAVGLALDRGPRMLGLAPVGFALIFAVTAWTYVLQGFIAAWLTNPRRRRALVAGLTLALVLGSQIPNLVINVFPSGGAHHPRGVPPHPVGHAGLAHLLLRVEPFIDARLAVAVLVGLSLLGALGLRRGYRSTLRVYLGKGGTGRDPASSGPSSVARAASPQPAILGRGLVERRLPWVSDQVSAVAAATLRSLLRAPEVAMVWGAALLLSLIAGAALWVRIGTLIPASGAPLALYAAMALSLFMLTRLTSNQFGLDRSGLRTLLLAPIARRRILLGKNLALAALAIVPSGILLVGGGLLLRLRPAVFAGAALQLVAVLAISLVAGNASSILAPYRVAQGSLRATKMPPLAALALFGLQLAVPPLLSPVALGPALILVGAHLGWRHAPLWDLAVSLGAAAGSLAIYAASLEPLGRWMQRRESTIVAKVNAATE